jgi:hypothetical protein
VHNNNNKNQLKNNHQVAKDHHPEALVPEEEANLRESRIRDQVEPIAINYF